MSKPVVLVTGSSGNIGTAVVKYLSAKHHGKVTILHAAIEFKGLQQKSKKI